MKKTLILLLLLTTSAGAQVTPPFAFWKSGAAPSFSPAYIDSLKGWYVAADLADSLGKSSGDTTYIWPNRAKWLKPYAMPDAFQTTDALKPIYYDSTYKFVSFDGSDDRVQTVAGVKYSQPYTVIAVYKSHAPKVADAVLWDGDGATNRAVGYHPALAPLVAVPRFTMFAGNNGTRVDRSPSLDTSYIVIGSYNGASSTVHYQSALYTDGQATTGANAISGITIGTTYNGTLPYNGRIYEVIVVHRALTQPEVDSIEYYLSTKYGITLP